MTKEDIIKRYYAGWQQKHWATIEALLADSFTFTSPNNDDHIDKAHFEAKCWPEADCIKSVQVNKVIERGDEAFVKYRIQTTNGSSFQNTEYFTFRDGKIKGIEVYFGGPQGYPSQKVSGI